MGPRVLIILDGWGYSETRANNAIAQAEKPHWDRWWQQGPHTLLSASGLCVGLPEGQMGNSEVGHLNIGAGRVVQQAYVRIESTIAENRLGEAPLLSSALDTLVQNGKALHVMGLLSPGGVHSHETHLFALIKVAQARGISQIYLHAFLDGRDTPPQSAEASLLRAEEVLAQGGRIATCIGRYYAMDRDNRWERTAQAYITMVQAQSNHHADTAIAALRAAYGRGETDEFVAPTIIGTPVPIQDGDLVLFANFRADRARQMCHALSDPDFTAFERGKRPALSLMTLTQYDKKLPVPVLFPPMQHKNVLAEVLQNAHMRQLHIAETEKYAHVTFFFNGGVEAPFEGEERILIPSPKVATYDLEPAMSAVLITDKIVASIEAQAHEVIIANFANADMVGHTGLFNPAKSSIEVLDSCLGRIHAALSKVQGEALITADHGNAECLYDEEHHQPHTAHTTNPVPCLYWGPRKPVFRSGGRLADVAPTLLQLLGLGQPIEMTGKSLFTTLD